jgi:Domain of unknown function (DUF1990)
MPGPWNGPVRVVCADEHAFRLTTLRGHLEAGQIEFRTARHDDGSLRFEIESWARAGDCLSHLLYNQIRLAKEIQLNMWTHVCLRSAKVAGGRIRGGIILHTRRVGCGSPEVRRRHRRGTPPEWPSRCCASWRSLKGHGTSMSTIPISV